MPLHYIDRILLRSECKKTLETFELWSKRVIHDELSIEYGKYYINFKNDRGEFLVRKSVRDQINSRSDTFTKPIDAATLDSIIYLLCKKTLYDKHFKKYLDFSFPDGYSEVKTFLDRLIEPRNKLYHSNEISIREAEQIICYSNDTISSFKNYYILNNMEKEYNVPTFIRAIDSFGNRFEKNDTPEISYLNNPECILRPNDILTIEVDVDPTFSPNSYNIVWLYKGLKESDKVQKNKISITICNEQVNSSFAVTCQVISNQPWHRRGEYDDYLRLYYKVLPTI